MTTTAVAAGADLLFAGAALAADGGGGVSPLAVLGVGFG